ncbi:MAG: DHH family phosphoesterase [Verrucomicrobia bacterium]|nr:MAG: DHH family phosphoesterase [Verrucomicrobiota bacterium]
MYYQEYSQLFSNSLKELIEKKVAVIGHIRPDGDCIGSQVALVRILNNLGATAIALNKDKVPEALQFLVKDTPFIHSNFSEYKDYIPITVDASDTTRIGDELRGIFPEIKINFDHHLSNIGFAEINIVDSQTAATCELLAGIFLDLNLAIDPIIAQALYVGIATDTGQFRYSMTNAQVFEICTKLIQCGAIPALAAHELYERESFGRILLLKEFLGTLKLELEGKLCVGMINEAMFKATGTNKEHTEHLVDYPRAIDSVVVAAVLEERSDNTIKGSLRAKNDQVRVDLLAGHFNGGGHAAAAGFSVQSKLEEFYPRFIQTIKSHLSQFNFL